MKSGIKRIAFIAILMVYVCTSLIVLHAYFVKYTPEAPDNLPVQLDVGALFGRLNDPDNTKWGSATNPYLIYENRHFKNLYILQNSKDSGAVNENSHFQISDANGKPCFIGGDSVDELLEIPSIGSEDFPFISILSGVKGDPFLLPTGEYSDTSVIGNIRVLGYAGQIDIGLFGNIGRADPNDDGTGDIVTTGTIRDLLLMNIKISTDAIGDISKPDHPDYYTENDHETNHIGILAGHAQYCELINISIYYKEDANTRKALVNAFDVDAPDLAKYTTAGGILGYYKQIILSGSESPVNSDGLDNEGGVTSGFGLGIVYSEDIWSFMENNYFGGEALNSEYGIQDTFDEKLYGINNESEEYFQIGVFTFAHSTQSKSDDSIAKLWKTADDNKWAVSTTGNYVSESNDLGIAAKKYSCKRVTNQSPNRFQDFGYTNYRYMIVAETNGSQYALVKYGATASSQKIDTSNFVIPEDQLNYYTFRPSTTRTLNSNYPPYGNGGYTYGAATTNIVVGATSRTQYFIYGNNVESADTPGYYVESERPLRIYSNTVSFMAAAGTGTIPEEGIRLNANGTGNNYQFRLQRTSGSNGSTSSWYVNFTEGSGFISGNNNSMYLKVYAVRITNNSSTPSENPVSQSYEKLNFSPTPGTEKIIDMRNNVLFYTGTPTSNNPATKFAYDLRTIESLGWIGNDNEIITYADTTLKMADPTSYYYISNITRGVLEGIPSPVERDATINVPFASIGFTVQGSGINGDTSKIFVIAATDPHQLVDQLITVSYLPTNSSGNINNDRVQVGSFALPSVPGSTQATTQTIYITEGNNTYTAYPNMNTLLVAYEFTVPSVQTRTYYLEASKGSANFVYLSAENTASVDNNPTHENDVWFDALNGLDYVCLKNNNIAVIGSSDYVKSQIAPYFGLTMDKEVEDTMKVLNVNSFEYSIFRYYDTSNDVHVINIYVTVTGDDPPYPDSITSAQLKEIMRVMNFNFTEWTYIDPELRRMVFSDVVNVTINNRTIDWETIADLYG